MTKQRRSKGDGGLFKRADGLWIGSVEIPSVDGKRRQKRVSSRNYRVAMEKLRELRRKVEQGVDVTTPKMMVAEWLTHWLTDIHAPQVRPKTAKFYEESIRLHIIPAIGAVRMDKLTPEQVRVMLRGLDSTRNRQRAHGTLKLALKTAVTDGLLDRNICDAVAKPKHVAGTRGAFDFDTARHIINTAIELDPVLASRWAAAFTTGARQAELIGLEWGRVDLDGGLIELSWQLQQLTQSHGCAGEDGQPVCGRSRPSYCPAARWELPDGYEHRHCYKSLVWTRPKTKTGVRVVPILPGLVDMLRHQPHGYNPHGMVWHHGDGRPLSPTQDYRLWRDLLDAAGLPPATLHAARHTTATVLQSLGVAEEVRMQIMGQSSITAHRGYVHVDQTQTRAALGKLAELLAPE